MSGLILFEITASDSHLQIVLPVIRTLRQRGVDSLVFSNCELNRKPSDIAPLEREHIPYVRLVETPLPLEETEFQRLAVPLFRRIPEEIRKVQPPLIVVLNDRNSPSLNFVRAGRKLGIPVLMLQESLRKDLFQRPSLRKLYFRWNRKIRTGIEAGLFHYGQGGCDHLSAWGGFSREYFLRVGVKPERITITGNPRFDVFASPDFDREAAAIRSRYDLPEEAFLLTFLSSPIEKMHIVSPEEKKEALGRMLDWIRNLRAQPGFASLRLAVKLHRAENVAWFAGFLRERNAADFAFLANQPLYPLLWASQASLMFSTTAGLEAALLRRPVAMLELSKPLDDWNFTGRGVAQTVASQEDLAAYLRLVREDAAFAGRCEAAAHYYLDHIGQASENVAGLVERLTRIPRRQEPR